MNWKLALAWPVKIAALIVRCSVLAAMFIPFALLGLLWNVIVGSFTIGRDAGILEYARDTIDRAKPRPEKQPGKVVKMRPRVDTWGIEDDDDDDD